MKHQNAYAKMMIAGCLSQAKKILEVYDEILYGPSPEELVASTHQTITGLLNSEEDIALFVTPAVEDDDVEQKNELFIKRILGAVSPIVSLTLRNKSLDGTYFRPALHLLGAVELMFSQYETDIRSQANPAGLVGMCDAMHADIKRSAVHSSGPRSFGDFLKDMRSQYNSFLGLGVPFRNDMSTRDKRKGRGSPNSRSQAWRSSDRVDDRNSTRGLRSIQPMSNTGAAANFAREHRFQESTVPFRGRGDCYAFLAGNCSGGNACRFLHRNP